MDHPYKCSECKLIVHEDCLKDVLQECPPWLEQNQKAQLEKLRVMFPNVAPSHIKDIFEWSETVEIAVTRLMEEDEKQRWALFSCCLLSSTFK